MRLRKVKDAYEKLLALEGGYFVPEAKANKGNWKQIFKNENPICIEIGCGKGQFITKMALAHPDINYVAIEKFDSVLLRAVEKTPELNISNLKFILADATEINEYFADKEVNTIYLTFSDPWPKKPHAKRRLTSPGFLKLYEQILDGELIQKTDNRHFFEYSLQSFNECGWKLTDITLDLHADTEKYPDNITTEFEDKWSPLGPIYQLKAIKK